MLYITFQKSVDYFEIAHKTCINFGLGCSSPLIVLKVRKQSPAIIIVNILIFFFQSMQNTKYSQVENLECINVAGEA